ncbi:MAG: glycosyltransferase [Solirubrobacteraceae bacterium]|nr:glycosyltransferase [Solirubrobacteraceae bacterium]
MKVVVVAEFYPRAADPVLGIWSHRQALAARDAGAEVEVLVLHRPVPPRSALDGGPRATALAAATMLRQPWTEERDGLRVRYVPFVSPPRPSSYHAWGAWAAPSLALALRALRRRFPFDLVHAHNAVPTADAVRRAAIRTPIVTSVHGGDVLYTAKQSPAAENAVRSAFEASALVLANSSGIARECEALGAPRTTVVHLGTDLPGEPVGRTGEPALSTIAHLVPRKRHGDVIRALWLLRDRWPDLRYVVVGDGPERAALAELAADLGVAERVQFTGQLPHEEAMRELWRSSVMVMPSTDEAFGVAYVEALAGGVPAIAALGEPGPEDIAAAGPGMVLVPPGDVERLATELGALLDDPRALRELGAHGRRTAEAFFSWEACGRATVAAYGDALR